MSGGIGSVWRGGFIYPVRWIQRSLVKPAPTQSKTLALPLLADMISCRVPTQLRGEIFLLWAIQRT